MILWCNLGLKFGKITSNFTVTEPVSVYLFNLRSFNTPCYHIVLENGTDMIQKQDRSLTFKFCF